jgi:hypothetical protein
LSLPNTSNTCFPVTVKSVYNIATYNVDISCIKMQRLNIVMSQQQLRLHIYYVSWTLYAAEHVSAVTMYN